MKNMRLTIIEQDGIPKEYDNTTASLCNYLLRTGCTDSELVAGKRIQELRDVALKLATTLIEEGRRVDPLDLSVIDIEVDSIKTVRLAK